MPLYSFQCSCGVRDDRFAAIADRDKPQFCSCGSQVPMQRVLVAPFVAADYPGYDCPVTGRRIEGRKAHNENLARTGSRLLEPGEVRDFTRSKAQADEAFADRIAESAAQAVAAMPAAKQERLANELAAGVDVSFVRSAATA